MRNQTPPDGTSAVPAPEFCALTSSLVHQLRDYWTARRGDRRMPRKSDIDPSELKPLLPYILLGNSFLNLFQMKRENDVLTLDLRNSASTRERLRTGSRRAGHDPDPRHQ